METISEEKIGLRISLGSRVAPGDRIGSAKQLEPGQGCYRRGNHIFASAVGTLKIMDKTSNFANNYTVHIELENGRIYASSQILSIGSKVLCKVGRITNQQVLVDIIAVEHIGALREHHGGLVRKEDIRLGATEEVKIHESFRPGDIILARIISLGDSRRFFLSTTENEMGVIRAVCSSSGKVMSPINWKEMECPETNVKERRKCAKPKDLRETDS
jgi:exosome complex component CSL4